MSIYALFSFNFANFSENSQCWHNLFPVLNYEVPTKQVIKALLLECVTIIGIIVSIYRFDAF